LFWVVSWLLFFFFLDVCAVVGLVLIVDLVKVFLLVLVLDLGLDLVVDCVTDLVLILFWWCIGIHSLDMFSVRFRNSHSFVMFSVRFRPTAVLFEL
jgi:hypothetical protein